MSTTPGPWEYRGAEGFFGAGYEPVISLGDDGGCSDPECRCGGALYHIEVSDSDADLIAAAPELLSALQRTMDWLASYPGGGALNVLEQARAAIAKAEGK